MRKARLFQAGAVLLVLPIGIPLASADTLYLKDGSQIQGTVKTLGAHKIRFKTDFAGTLKIVRGKIAGVSTDGAVPLALQSGRRIHARLAYDPATQTQRYATARSGAAAGTVQMSLSRLSAIAPERIAERKRNGKAEKFTLPEYPSSAQLSHPKWSGAVSLGLNGDSGNAKDQNLRASVSALRNTGTTRLNLLASANRATSNGSQTNADYLAHIGYERDFNRRWYAFAQQDFERNKFENYALRSRTTFGPGYFVLRKRHTIFKVRGGLGYQYEKYYDSGNADNNLLASAGWHFAKVFDNYVQISHDFTIYPSLTHSPTKNFTLTSVLTATVPLAHSAVWSLSAQLENDYNNHPQQADTKKLDTSYSLSIQRSF